MAFVRWLLLTALVLIGSSIAVGPGSAQAQTIAWPERPVRIVVPFTAGGASDVLTRLLADQLQGKFGQSFIIDNRTGAGGNIGMDVVAKAAPDGYTIASATIGTLTINQFLFSKLGYDPISDFAYVSTIWENCNVFAVSPTNPARTVAEFLSWAKKRPHGVTFGSSGVGTTPHLAGELFRMRTGLTAVHVPFRGAAQTIPALMAGDIDFAMDNIASYVSFLREGKVRGLAVTCRERWPTVPELPTMAEAGVPDFVVTSWGAFVMPAGTPAPIVSKLAAAIRDISADPAYQARYMAAGGRAVSSTPEQLAAFADQERLKWKEAVQISGARVE